MDGIFGQKGSGKNGSHGNRKVCIWNRKSLILAGLGILCLLAGCARKEPGQTEHGAENLAETPSAEAWSGTNPPTEITDEGNPPTKPSDEGNLSEGSQPQGSPAGGSEQEPPVLADVLYDKKQLGASKPITIQFLFSDGDSVERELDDTFGEVNHMYVTHDDMTGDGTEEVIVHRAIDDAARRYGVLDIFQVEGKEIRQLFPTDDIEGLAGNVRDEDVFLVDRYDRKGYGLHVEIYREGNGPDKAGEKALRIAEEMELFYEDGKWVRLPERELRAEVSFDSDSPEARVYEAFVRGECEAELFEQYYSDTWYLDPLPAGQESFSFKDILDAIVSGIRNERTLDSMEKVECALIDCGGDGRPELAVRAYGVSIYSMRDDSETIMIFRCRDGKVEWIYSVDCWARSDTDIYTDGYVSGGGSGGAFTHYVWDGMIGADGVYREYNIYIETGQGLSGMSGYNYKALEELPAEFYECTMGEETIYGYYILEDTPEDVRENVMLYIAENEEEMGVKFLPSAEMHRLLDKWAESLGITEEMGERWETKAKRIPWQVVEGCEDYLYGQS